MASTKGYEPVTGAVAEMLEIDDPSSPYATPGLPAQAKRPSVTCAEPTKKVTSEDADEKDKEDTNAKTRKKHLRDVYWLSPAKMVSCLVFGILMSISHHLYYQSREGEVVGDEYDQQFAHQVGNFFAFVVQSSFRLSIGFAYIQWLWMTLKEKEVSVGTLNSAFAALYSLLFVSNKEMRRKIKVASLIALTAWCLPVPSFITPGTLFVNSTSQTLPAWGPVRVLDMASPANESYFAYSVPAAGPNSTLLQSQMFLGPRTIVDRLSEATASGGQILPITPPYVNASYQINFYGPMVQCAEANATQQEIMENLISQSLQPQGNITQILNGYYAYVPNLSNPDQAGSVIEDRLQQPSNGSNQLWLSFRRNGTGWIETPIPTCPIVEYMVCQLYNASYELNLTFMEGNQTIQGYPPTILNEVDYPVLNLTEPSDLVQMSYSAYMWAFTDQLVGEMGLYNDTSTNATTPAIFNDIKTSISATSILGSSDLDCFFATNKVIPSLDGENKTGNTPQRQADIDLAKNEPLDVLIPELAFNTTVSLMNDVLLAPLSYQNVNTTQSVNLWGCHKANLWTAYGVSIFVTIIANLLGGYAYLVNKVAHDISFSSIVSSTTDKSISKLFNDKDCHTRGKLPLPEKIEKVEIKFKPLDEGGLGFQTVEEIQAEKVRRESEAGISSPLMMPM